jgi:hypothetical protein
MWLSTLCDAPGFGAATTFTLSRQSCNRTLRSELSTFEEQLAVATTSASSVCRSAGIVLGAVTVALPIRKA